MILWPMKRWDMICHKIRSFSSIFNIPEKIKFQIDFMFFIDSFKVRNLRIECILDTKLIEIVNIKSMKYSFAVALWLSD